MITHDDERSIMEARIMGELTDGIDFFYNPDRSEAVVSKADGSCVKFSITSSLIEDACFVDRMLSNNLDIAHMDSRVGWNETDDYRIEGDKE